MTLLQTPTVIGDTVTVTANQNYLQGELFKVGALIGVALHDALSGQELQIGTHGVFDLPKPAEASTVGTPVLYLSKTQASTELGNVTIGVSVKNAATSDPTIRTYFTGFFPE